MIRKKKTLTITLLLLALVCIGAATAQTMTVGELGFTGPQTLLIYNSTGALLGTYNTTTNGITLPTDDFILIVKPETSNWAVDEMLGNALDWAGEYWYAWTFVLAALVFGLRRR